MSVLPTDATLKTGTYTFEPPGETSYVGKSAEYTRRKLMEFPVDPAQVRVHIANYNLFDDEMVKSGSLDDISLWIGEAAVGADGKPTGAFVPGTQVRIPIASTLAAGQWGTSDWLVNGVDFKFDADKQYMFSYGFGTSGGSVANVSGGGSVGWGSRDAGDAGLDAPGLTSSTAGYLDVWFEYQYADKGQPSIFVVSNSSAVQPLRCHRHPWANWSTWVNQWADTYHGVIAGNIAVPAVCRRHSTTRERWSFYDGQVEIPLDPDAVIYMAINSSDAASDLFATNLAQDPAAHPRGDRSRRREVPERAPDPLGHPAADRIPDHRSDGGATALTWTPAGVAVVVQLLGQTLDAVLASQAPSARPLSVRQSLQPLAVQTDQKRRLPA